MARAPVSCVLGCCVIFYAGIICPFSYEARRLNIEIGDSGSGDYTWAVELFNKNEELESTSATVVGFKVGDVVHIKFEAMSPVVDVQLVTKDEYESCRSHRPVRVFNATMEYAAFKLEHP